MTHRYSFLSILFLIMTSPYIKGRPVIYEEDNRVEPSEIKDKIKISQAIPSVALLLETRDISNTSSTSYKRIATTSLGKSMNLCPTERFYNQSAAGFCTGFLVTDDILVTAGHCLSEKKSCEDFSVLFDFTEDRADHSKKLRVPSKNIFRCIEVLYFSDDRENNPDQDIAIIRLDRPTKRPHLFLASQKIKDTSILSLIGHPLGLPMKVAHSGSLLQNSEEKFFSLAIDSYSGNSGSPLINESSGKVEGMLIRGHNDFILKGNCYVSAECTKNSCFGEDGLRSSLIKELLGPFL